MTALVRERQDDPISIREVAKKLRISQKESKLQLIRREFCDEYANTSKNWASEWSSFLNII